jgi:hypothetical protein
MVIFDYKGGTFVSEVMSYIPYMSTFLFVICHSVDVIPSEFILLIFMQ